MKLPNQVEKTLSILHKAGYEGYIVGGCVRDMILGKIPTDYDITTSALPIEIIKFFSDFKIIETGIKHGTVTVIVDGMPIEVTTFRIDGKYSDNRHPDSVSFSNKLLDDLSRRDFTINALCFSKEAGIIDPFGGLSDIKNKQIKCVGNPDLRFSEDALRIMRALRFASCLGFEIEKNTSDSIKKNKLLLKNVASERLSAELIKLLSGKPKDILLNFTEVFGVFMPELMLMKNFPHNNPHHMYDVFTHTVLSVENIENDPVLRLCMLLHDIGKPVTYTEDFKEIGHFKGHNAEGVKIDGEILNRLKFDNKTKRRIKTLILYHDCNIHLDNVEIKKWLKKIGKENFSDLLKVKIADTKAKSPEHLNEIKEIYNIYKEYQNILNSNQCFSLKSLAVNGNDSKNLGYSGSQIGDKLEYILDLVIENRLKNNKNDIIDYLIRS